MIPHTLLPNDGQESLAVALAADGRAGRWVVRWTHKQGAFDGIYGETVRVHPLTRGIAYVARRGQSQVVVQNGQASAPFDAVWFDSLRFTPNGDMLFFLAEHAGRTVFVVNGVTRQEFEQVLDMEPLALCQDGTAYGLELTTVTAGQRGLATLQPRLPQFRLGKG